MAKSPHVLLAEALSRVEKSANEGIVRSQNIARRDRERLLKGGWLQVIITGWYMFTSPQAREGESTTWYISYWHFIQQYLQERFGEEYCLSAESSLDIHTANNVIPQQVVVICKSGGNYMLPLPHNTSIVIYQDPNNLPAEKEVKNKIQTMSVGLALCRVAKSFFQTQVLNAEIALSMIKDPSEILRDLLQNNRVTAAGRLAGAYRYMGKNDFADNILQTMKSAGFDINEENPFEVARSNNFMNERIISPYYARIKSMWAMMRGDVIANFPKQSPTKANSNTIFKRIDDTYINDAYNSLSIEGYRVTKELITKIKNGQWNPDKDSYDSEQRNVLAAKGYYQAFLAVKGSLKTILSDNDVITVIKRDLSKWYQALFSSSVEAGLVEAAHLAGYRNDRVFIRNSLHVPPPKEAVLDCMSAFFECLQTEDNPIVRAVLGHFIFVFIHPYMDGNGRITRFLMNTLWIAAGYPWTIVRLELRNKYFQALEQASVHKQIKPFTLFLASEMAVKWS